MEVFHLEIVNPRLQFGLAALLGHAMNPAVVDDRFVVDEEARTVARMGVEFGYCPNLKRKNKILAAGSGCSQLTPAISDGGRLCQANDLQSNRKNLASPFERLPDAVNLKPKWILNMIVFLFLSTGAPANIDGWSSFVGIGNAVSQSRACSAVANGGTGCGVQKKPTSACA